MPTRDSIYHWSGENVQIKMSFIWLCFDTLSQLKHRSNHLPSQEPSWHGINAGVDFYNWRKSLQYEMSGSSNWALKTRSPAFFFLHHGAEEKSWNVISSFQTLVVAERLRFWISDQKSCHTATVRSLKKPLTVNYPRAVVARWPGICAWQHD